MLTTVLKPISIGIIFSVCFAFHSLPGIAAPEIVSKVVLPESSLPSGVAVDSETGAVYVADSANAKIDIFDSDLNLISGIATVEGPYRIAIDSRAETKRLFVGEAGIVEVFSLPSGTLLCSLPAGPAPHVAFNAASEKLYVAVAGANLLKVYGGQDSCEFLTQLPMGVNPVAVAIDEVANRVYLPIHHEQKVSVIDGGTDSFIENIPVIAGDPTDVAVDPITHHVYVAYSQGNAITQIDTGPSGLGPYVQTHLTVGDGPRFVQVDPGIERAYVSVINFQQLAIVTSGIVETPVNLGMIPAFTGVNTKTHCAYTSGSLGTLRAVVKICDNAILQPAVCDIQMNQLVYTLGDIITAQVFRIANQDTSSVAVEWKVWLNLPSGTSIPIINIGHDSSFILPTGSDQDFGPLPLFPVTPGFPLGEYELSCRFLNPVTGEEIALDINAFEVQEVPIQ